ncbi:TetR/AcrR family transcriptional regulator [Bifidobacterium aquikefiricola]|uniref:TetR/AcrR family transcriptional regulator n=1 Tax=Bifidobacterium aquikefiricola TaxID=3059038 RepID=A0AB39U6Z4_9BIFI
MKGEDSSHGSDEPQHPLSSSSHQSHSPNNRAKLHTNRSIHRPKEDTKGERTKDRILDAALHLFSQSGSNAVSIRAIASEAGISHSGLLRYFADKDDLIVQAIRRRDKTADAARSFFANNGEVTPETIIPWLLETIRQNAANPGIVATFVKLSAEATDAGHPAHEYFHMRYLTFTTLLADSIAELSNVDTTRARRVAQEFIAYMDGIQIQWLLDPESVDMLADARDFLERAGIDVQGILRRYAASENSDDER